MVIILLCHCHVPCILDSGILLLVKESNILLAKKQSNQSNLVLNFEDQGIDEFQDVDSVEDHAWSLPPHKLFTRLSSVSVVGIGERNFLQLVIDGPQNLTDTSVDTCVRQDTSLLVD